MADPIFKEDNSWYFLDENSAIKHGSFYTKEEAEQELALYCLQLDGTLPQISTPAIEKATIWESWDNNPLIGVYTDEKGECLFCIWDRTETSVHYLSFRIPKEDMDRITTFILKGYEDLTEHVPVLTYILRIEKPFAWWTNEAVKKTV